MTTVKNAVQNAVIDMIGAPKPAESSYNGDAARVKNDNRFEELLKNSNSYDKEIRKPEQQESRDPYAEKKDSLPKKDELPEKTATAENKTETKEQAPTAAHVMAHAHTPAAKKTAAEADDKKTSKKPNLIDDLTASLKGLLQTIQTPGQTKSADTLRQADELKSKIRHALVKAETGIKTNEGAGGIQAAELKDLFKQIDVIRKSIARGDAKPGQDLLKEMKPLTEQLQEAIQKLDNRKRDRRVEQNNIAQPLFTVKTDIAPEEKRIFATPSNDQPAGAVKDTSGSNASAFNFSRGFSSLRSEASRMSEAMTGAKTGSGEFTEQLKSMIERSRVTVKDGQNANMTMRLNPEHLGRMNLQMGLENGVLHAKFTVESEDAKALLMQNIESLKENLSQNGVSVGSFEVNVNNQSWNGGAWQKDEPLPIDKSNTAQEVTAEYRSAEYVHDGQLNLVV